MVRRIVDSFQVNIPTDVLIKVLSRYPNLKVPELKHSERLNERSFALNFLQKNIKKVKFDEKLAQAFADDLTPFWKVEAKQRVIAYMILDTLNNGTIKFQAFYDLFRYVEAFNILQNNYYVIKPSGMTSSLASASQYLTQEEVNRCNMIRSHIKFGMNFKHFLLWLRAPEIFKKYKLEEEQEYDIPFEELEEGMSHIALPTLKPIVFYSALKVKSFFGKDL